MRRNVAGQFVTAKLASKTDGSAVTTGTTTVYVVGDAGTQAVGSVGSGAATHEGNGVWSYAPAQAETNYTQVDFVFVNTSAVNNGPSIYPTAYDANGRYDVGAVGGTAQTARDLGASVLLSAGTGTGQLDFTSGVVKANAVQLLGTAWLTPVTLGTPDINVKFLGGTTQTGRDLGASVLISSGAGVGQLNVTSGVVQASLVQILGTALTETAGLLAGGFKKFFNVASPTGTLNSIPDFVAGAAGGLFIAGSNGPTSITSTGLTANIVGNLSGSVGSVTGLTNATIASAVSDEALSGHTTAGTVGKALTDIDVRGSRTVVRGTVTTGATTTSIPTSAFSPAGASADQFKGRIVVFDNDTTTTTLRGEATDITASTNAATPTLTVSTLSAAPASGDTFSVL